MNNRNVFFIIFLGLCLLLKLYFIVKDNPALEFNPDDQRNYTIAQNYVSGKGYGIYDLMARRYRLSAYHTSSTIFLYQFLLQKQVSQKTIVIVFYILSTILYVLAILFVYRILLLLGVSRVMIYSATALFALYPSVQYAVGPKYHFDNLVMPLHIINFYFLLKLLKDRTLTLPVYSFLIASITFCCFFRTQVLPLYFITGIIVLTVYIKDRIKLKRAGNAMLYFLIALGITICIAFVPILQKNKKMFGDYIISTQAGFELLNGHNGINGGNWIISHPNDPLDNYVHEKIQNVEMLDEYTESKARGLLAKEWIRANPMVEIKYIFKKMARYFMPENWEPSNIQPVFKYHPFNIFVHSIFLMGILASLLKDRSFLFSNNMLLLLTPVVATLLLSVVFFFDFRLRYHAEPFVIIVAAYLADRYLKRRAQHASGKI